MGRGYIWLWPEFSRVNLTRPVSLVSTSPRNRINRDPLRTVFSLFLPSFLSFFLSRGSLKKYPRIISFRTRYLPLMLDSLSRSNGQFSGGKELDETTNGLSRLDPSSQTLRSLSRKKKKKIVRKVSSFQDRCIDSSFFFTTIHSKALHRHPSGKTLNYLLWKAAEVSRDPLSNLPLSLSLTLCTQLKGIRFLSLPPLALTP